MNLHFYIGSEAEYINRFGQKEKRILTSVNYKDDYVKVSTNEATLELVNKVRLSDNAVMPLLIPLEKMSEEDKIKLIELGDPNRVNISTREHRNNGGIYYFYTNAQFPDAGRGDAHLYFNKLNFAQFSYLLSKSYDIENLIPKGQANEKVK